MPSSETLAGVLASATSGGEVDELDFGLQRLLDGIEALVVSAPRKNAVADRAMAPASPTGPTNLYC